MDSDCIDIDGMMQIMLILIISYVASDQLVSVQGALNTEGDPSTREAELLESKKFEIKKQQENAMEAMQQARNVQAKLQ